MTSYLGSTLTDVIVTDPIEPDASGQCPEGFVWSDRAGRCLPPSVIQTLYGGGSGVFGENTGLGQIGAKAIVIVIGLAFVLLAVYAWVTDKPVVISLPGRRAR